MEDIYTRGEKEFLLKIARITLEKYLRDGERFQPHTINQKLWEKRGVFVTLKKLGQLRGCIGYLEPTEAIILAVRDNVISAARDPRFLPLEFSELPEMEIEISILTNPEQVDFKKIKKGDGVVLKRGASGATYLPQVWEDLPEPDIFFGTLCQKAGLDADCYKDKETKFLCYQAFVFSESNY
jgi:AmmeMemoRadiSam system protein A